MKSVIFNQRVTVFTNSFIGYSDTHKNRLVSKLGSVEETGILQPDFAVMLGPQQIISSSQIPQNAPWFIKTRGVKVAFQPGKIDVISDTFINTIEEESNRINELTRLLTQINEAISIGNITRMAYAPSLGLESDNDELNSFWNSLIGIVDLDGSPKREKMIRYNIPCQDNGLINRVVTITEGQRAETISADNKIENKTMECVIVSIDINTHGNDGCFSTDDVNIFCTKAQKMKEEILSVINR